MEPAMPTPSAGALPSLMHGCIYQARSSPNLIAQGFLRPYFQSLPPLLQDW